MALLLLNSAEELLAKRDQAATDLRTLVDAHLNVRQPLPADPVGLQIAAIVALFEASFMPKRGETAIIELPLGTFTAAVTQAYPVVQERAAQVDMRVKLKPSTVTPLAWALHVTEAPSPAPADP